MKLYIMTDMEGVCGVLNHDDWVMPSGRYYEDGKHLLTQETNAAVAGFFEAGATEIFIADGHGAGGINQSSLDIRTTYCRYFLPAAFPFMLDRSFDAIAWVGQHAKAGAPYAHIAHTGWFNVLDYSINEVSIGEFGQMALCAAQLGVLPIFGAGDEAFTQEAASFVNGIETVSVKKGLLPGSGDELDCDAYRLRNNPAIHLNPGKARELIKAGAKKSLQRFIHNRDSFSFPAITPPYRKRIVFRSDGKNAAYEIKAEHPDDLILLINAVGERSKLL